MPVLPATDSSPHNSVPRSDIENNSWVSLTIAITIILLWFASAIALLKLQLNEVPLIAILIAMWLRAFLHTGIFIIIHDSIHGVVSDNQKLNDFMGYVAAFLYAILPYQTLAENHRTHHRYPATDRDPDFYHEPDKFWLWYGSFMKDYQKGKQFWILFWGMTVIFWILIFLKISVPNIFLFWVIPIIISSLQLFTFGIYLPHRPQSQGYSDRHRAKSSNYSVWLSFLTCYHFGYHWEHHQYPNLPWYRLPLVRK